MNRHTTVADGLLMGMVQLGPTCPKGIERGMAETKGGVGDCNQSVYRHQDQTFYGLIT